MQPVQVIMIMSLTTMLLITALLLIIRSMPSRPGLKWWMAASMMQAVIFFLAIKFFESDADTTGTIIFYSLAMAAATSLSVGTLLFASVPINIKKRAVFYALSIVIVVSLIQVEQLFLASVYFAFYNAANLFQAAYKIYHIKFGIINFKIPSILLATNGFHWLNFPFLSTVEWFAPYGVAIGMILLAAIFLNLSVCVLLQFIVQTQDSERRAVKASTYDSLTGFYNRSHLETLFNNYVKEADQIERSFILLYFDLDGFKTVNDTYGHKAGDLILQTVSERMSQWLGNKGDGIRIGGDELVVLTRLRGDYDRNNAVIAAEQLLSLIEEPITDGTNTYKVSASIGGCSFGQPHTNLDEMLNKSDTLMYAAKQAGGKRIYFSRSAVVVANVDNVDKQDEIANQKMAV